MNEEGKEGMQAYQINYKSIEDAVPALTKYFGFHVCDSSDQTTVGQKVHPLSLAAKFLGNIPVIFDVLTYLGSDKSTNWIQCRIWLCT